MSADPPPAAQRRALSAGATGDTGATDAQALAVSVREAYRTYVAFHSEYEAAESGTLMLWTLHTHVYDVADVTPYILVTAPTSEAGKSRIFDVARHLVRKPFVVVDPTPAALFHAIDLMSPTLLVDEADMIRENKELRAVLNAGYQPGSPIPRRHALYQVFGPKMFAGITHDKPPLTDATLSRCIQIPMRRKTSEEPVRRFISRQAAEELTPIHAALVDWAVKARDDLEAAEPELPPELSDRQRDSWAPLLAIADYLGPAWGAAAREWAVTLYRAIPRAPDPAVQILRDCKQVLDDHPGTRITSRDLARKRNELEVRDYDEDLTPEQLGRRLAGFGIHRDSSPFRTGGRDSPTQRGYTFRRFGKYVPAWADAFARYGLTEES